MQPEPRTARSQELPSRREPGSICCSPSVGKAPHFWLSVCPGWPQKVAKNTSLCRVSGRILLLPIPGWRNGKISWFGAICSNEQPPVLPGFSASSWLQVLLFWGMPWSLKLTEMNSARLLLLQIKQASQHCREAGNAPCLPEKEGGKEGSSSRAMEEGRLCLHNLSPSLATCWTCKRSLFPWKRALSACAAASWASLPSSNPHGEGE